MAEARLWGYPRPDGDVGIRNYVAIVAAQDNSNPLVRRVASAVKGTVAVTCSFGRGLMAEDLALSERTLSGLATNPNVYGAVVVSLEPVSAGAVVERIRKTGRPAAAFLLEDAGTLIATERATRAALEMVVEAGKLEKVPLPWEKLVVGLECGGSDGSSGMVSNPATGKVSDMVVALGGTTILSEPMEVMGGEHVLARRAKDDAVAQRLIQVVRFCQSYANERGIDVLGTNPTPDNIAGGLSTIEEKALGAVHKAGSSTLMEVVDYGVRPKERGFCFMDAPAPGVENLTALAAGGAHVTIFSTGRGNPIGNPISPTIKVSGNPETVKKLRDNIDVDLSAVITEGMSLEKSADILFEEVVAVCNGKMTKAEMLGEVEISISRLLRTL